MEPMLDGLLVRPYLTPVKTTVSTKGQLVLPVEIRQQDNIKPGQEFEIERLDRGEYRLVRVAPPPNEGLVDWLLACPEKAIPSPSSPSPPARCELRVWRDALRVQLDVVRIQPDF